MLNKDYVFISALNQKIGSYILNIFLTLKFSQKDCFFFKFPQF